MRALVERPGGFQLGLITSLVLAACVSGCSRQQTPRKRATSPEVNAMAIGTAMRESLSLARSYPESAARYVAEILVVLESSRGLAYGPHQATYDQLTVGCRELKQMVDQKAPDAELRRKLDELLNLTASLPQLQPPPSP